MTSSTVAPWVVLCGPMGSGKSSVGKRLANAWEVTFRDTDHDVESTTGRTISEIFASDGEPAFRELEHQAVLTALREHDGVLALGGGAVLDPRTQRELRTYQGEGGHIVFLDVSLRFAAMRVGMDANRPLLAGNPRARWAEIMTQRRPIYEDVADLHISTDHRTLAAVAQEIRHALGG